MMPENLPYPALSGHSKQKSFRELVSETDRLMVQKSLSQRLPGQLPDTQQASMEYLRSRHPLYAENQALKQRAETAERALRAYQLQAGAAVSAVAQIRKLAETHGITAHDFWIGVKKALRQQAQNEKVDHFVAEMFSQPEPETAEKRYVYNLVYRPNKAVIDAFSSAQIAADVLLRGTECWAPRTDPFEYDIEEVELDGALAKPFPGEKAPEDVRAYWACTLGAVAVFPEFRILARPLDAPLPEPEISYPNKPFILIGNGLEHYTHGYGETREEAESAARAFFARKLAEKNTGEANRGPHSP